MASLHARVGVQPSARTKVPDNLHYRVVCRPSQSTRLGQPYLRRAPPVRRFQSRLCISWSAAGFAVGLPTRFMLPPPSSVAFSRLTSVTCRCKRSASALPACSKLAARELYIVVVDDEKTRRSGACPTSAVPVVVKSLVFGAADTQDGLLQPCIRPHNSALPTPTPHLVDCIFTRPSHDCSSPCSAHRPPPASS